MRGCVNSLNGLNIGRNPIYLTNISVERKRAPSKSVCCIVALARNETTRTTYNVSHELLNITDHIKNEALRLAPLTATTTVWKSPSTSHDEPIHLRE